MLTETAGEERKSEESQEESPKLRTFLLQFHTQMCECKEETCLFAHQQTELRRRPELLPGGKWNYAPVMCPQGATCKYREKCKKAHSNDEIRYHPDLYKTEMCRFPLTPKGICLEYGLFCPYAHHQAELRVIKHFPVSPRHRGKPARTAPPQREELELLQLRQELEQLKTKALCTKCRLQVKEWLLNCGHLVCADCVSGALHQCPCCYAPLRKMHHVRLSDK